LAIAVRFLSVGDTALLVEFGNAIDRALSRRVLQLDTALRAARPAGVVETVPTFRSLLVHYNPLATSRAKLEPELLRLIDTYAEGGETGRLWRIPVCYEGDFAPDLEEVAHRVGLSPPAVVQLHVGVCYHVYMLGFLPGFPYMGDLPPPLALPRRADPRVRVPAGSISIATSLTAIYPFESPGGWHLIGTTPLKFFDASRTPPALLAPGDAVRFEPIDAAAFAHIKEAVDAGSHAVESGPLAR
jgi:inhibitor of KinA